MCPHWLYRLPACYLLTAVGMIMLTDSLLLWLAGALLFVAGAASWMMRPSYRRTDLVIFPTKAGSSRNGSTRHSPCSAGGALLPPTSLMPWP